MSAPGPLFVAMAGGRPRLRRERTPAPRELTLHMPVAKLLRDHLLEGWKFTHVPSGEIRDIRTAVKLKAMGTQKGWPDFILISPHGSVRCLELKRQGAALTDEQDEFRLWCIRHGIPYVTAWTLEQVLAAFGQWGCTRLKIEGLNDR